MHCLQNEIDDSSNPFLSMFFLFSNIVSHQSHELIGVYRIVSYCIVSDREVNIVPTLWFTFQHNSELCSSWCSCYIGWVLYITKEGPIVIELSWTELDWDVSLVDVANELHSVFELGISCEYFPIIIVKDLQTENCRLSTECRFPLNFKSTTQMWISYFLSFTPFVKIMFY